MTTPRRAEGSRSKRVRFEGIDLSDDETRCELRIAVNGVSYPFSVRALTEGITLDPTANAVLPVALVAGMSETQDIDLGGHPVSKTMLEAMEAAQEVYRCWFDHFGPVDFEGYVPWQAGSRVPDMGRGTACFFSGGVDAFYTLLQHRHEIDSILFVHGLDFAFGSEKLAQQTAIRREVSEKIQAVGRALDVGVVEVEVDFESLRKLRIPWHNVYGCKHACIAHLLQGHFSRFLASSSQTFRRLEPDGYHPLTDPSWTSETVRIESRGYDASRIEKLRTIADHTIVRQTLRVCGKTRNGRYNCSRCEKCIRTQLALLAISRLDDFETLEPTIDIARLASLSVPPKARKYHLEVIDELRRSEENSELARELETILDLPPSAWQRFKRGRAYRGLKRRRTVVRVRALLGR